VKVLFISGYTDDALVNLGVLDGNLSFLEKPFSPARLAQTIRKVLDNDNLPGPAPDAAKSAGTLVSGSNPAGMGSLLRRSGERVNSTAKR
jgi:FixJ family two-component response regulator